MKIHDFRHLFLQLNKGFENFVIQIDNFSLGIAKLFFGKIDLLRKIKSSPINRNHEGGLTTPLIEMQSFKICNIL